MNGHKETIGLAETQRESSRSPMGGVELNETDLSPSSQWVCDKNRWRHNNKVLTSGPQ